MRLSKITPMLTRHCRSGTTFSSALLAGFLRQRAVAYATEPSSLITGQQTTLLALPKRRQRLVFTEHPVGTVQGADKEERGMNQRRMPVLMKPRGPYGGSSLGEMSAGRLA